MIAVTEVITPVDFSLIEPVEVVPLLQWVTAVPPLATAVPFGVGVTRPWQLACIGGVPVANVLRPVTVTVPPVMVVPVPWQPVTELVLEMVCWVGVLLIPGEKVELPDPPVQVSSVDAKAGVVPRPTAAAAVMVANATPIDKRLKLRKWTYPPVEK
jgi:hypothetical protein